MAPAPSPTLYSDLTTPQTEHSYPATDVIYKLIQLAGADVSSFRRNPQISYRLVELARDLYDEINKLIHEVDRDGNWDKYDKYTQAIDPLEQALLDIVPVTDEEQAEHLVTGHSVEECTASIAKWDHNRKKIRECFRTLRTGPELKPLVENPRDTDDDIGTAYTHDDQSYLHSLFLGIQENMPKIKRQKIQSFLKSVRDGLQSVVDLQEGSTKQSINEGLSTLTIKCAMITYGVTQLMVDEATPPTLRTHLHSEGVWKVAKELVEHMHTCLKSNGSTLARLEAAYKIFESVLLKQTIIELPDSYFHLVPMVGKIGRAYYAQSLLLLSLCRQAASEFEKKKTMENGDALEKAFAQTIKALSAAAGIKKQANGDHGSANGGQANGDGNGSTPNGIKINVSTPNGESDETEGGADGDYTQLFEKSINDLKTCFEQLELENAAELPSRLNAAQDKDRQRVQQVNEKLRGLVFDASRELISVTLNVHENGREGREIIKLTYNVPPRARLGFIKWNAVKQLPEPSIAKISYFENPAADANQPGALSLDTEIKSLATENKCTLYWIVTTQVEGNSSN